MEFVKDDATRRQLELLMTTQNMDRPMMLPPGVPAERVKELREALNATLADPAFRAEPVVAVLAEAGKSTLMQKALREFFIERR